MWQVCPVETKFSNKIETRKIGVSGPVVAAFAGAIGLMIATGAGFRVLASYLDRPTDSVPMTCEELGKLAMDIGLWHGRDVPLDERIVRATASDAHVNRVYQRGTETVSLYVAYGVRARDLMPHRPEVCYPDSGWTANGSKGMELPLADGSALPCRVYRFERTGPGSQSVTVLNYYIVDGRYSPDVSLLRSKAWRGSGGIRYTAQVQITCSTDQQLSGGLEEKAVSGFAAEAAPSIRALLPVGPGKEGAASTGQARSVQGGGS